MGSLQDFVVFFFLPCFYLSYIFSCGECFGFFSPTICKKCMRHIRGPRPANRYKFLGIPGFKQADTLTRTCAQTREHAIQTQPSNETSERDFLCMQIHIFHFETATNSANCVEMVEISENKNFSTCCHFHEKKYTSTVNTNSNLGPKFLFGI